MEDSRSKMPRQERDSNRQILSDYKKNKKSYEILAAVAVPLLEQKIRKSGIRVQTVTYRLKTPRSLHEKLNRKRDKYDTIADVTDLLGIRAVCYFAEDVDKVAAIVAKLFVVDWDHSIDQRKEISPTNFGYLSLHYICSLRPDAQVPESLRQIRFEVQIRSSLQNIWAEIEHDLGYKTDFGIPKSVQREFAQIASLLEIADKGFGEIRTKMNHYEYTVRKEIRDDEAHDLPLDLISLREFMNHSRQFTQFMQKILEISGHKKIIRVSPESYLENLDLLNIHTIGDLLQLLEQEQEHALLLFRDMQQNAEMDELVTSIGLFLLCQARLVWSGRSEKAVLRYYRKTARTEQQAERRTRQILEFREKYHA